MMIGRFAPRRASAATLSSRGAGAGAAAVPFLGGEELGRPVVGLGLHVLAEGERDRAAVGGVGHGGEGAGERGQELLGAGDAVEVAADRAEGVVGGDGAVAEVLDLLQHRVGGAVGEDVAGDEEDGEAVDVRQRGGGDHVEGAGADRGGDGHRALAVRAPWRRRWRRGPCPARCGRARWGSRRRRRRAPRRCRRRCRGRRSPSSRRGRAGRPR